LLEYACCFLPCQQNAVVEAVSKALPIPDEFLKAMGVDLPPLPTIGFTPLEEYEQALERALNQLDLTTLGEKIVQTQLDRLRGRI